MKHKTHTVIILILSMIFSSSAFALARFSRANCINNESITFDPVTPHEWRFVLSDHLDLLRPDPIGRTYRFKMHRQGSGIFLGCTPAQCFWTFERRARVAVVDAFEGNQQSIGQRMRIVGGKAKRWFVVGRHDLWVPNRGIIEQFRTAADDCSGNLIGIIRQFLGG